jgi:G6PDH family F420-dependent oxidoreductase
MVQIGYALSSEEHTPNDLVRNARLAEEAGFTFALISDHYHPWVDAQGHSPFVWSVIGGIAQATERLELGTGVTCPIIRIHPAIIAQAVATAASMMPGRFFLGVGTGENLNEHILGDKWPEVDIRRAMLEEAIDVMRLLWQGGYQSHYGTFFEVENARIYTLPEEQPRIMVAGSGTKAAELAGRAGDGFIGLSPDREIVQTFEQAGGQGKPRYAQFTVCWAEDEQQAIATAKEIWPNAASRATCRRNCRSPCTSSRHPRTSPTRPSPRPSCAAPIRGRTSRRSRRSPTPGTRMCTSTRSVATRKDSCASTRSR